MRHLELLHKLFSAATLLMFETWGTTDPEKLIALGASKQTIETARLMGEIACEIRDPRD